MKEHSVLFWDFDGVVKDSVGAKTDAYERLFESSGAEIKARIRRHHEANGGVSRYEKIPLYLKWAGMPQTDEQVARYCETFAAEVCRSVVESPWVPGAKEYLQKNFERQSFFVVTGTPQAEMEIILSNLDIDRCFREVHGAPESKAEAVASILRRWRIDPGSSLLIGDSESDYAAARTNGVQFLLRRTSLNVALQGSYCGPKIENFIHE